LAHRGRRIGAVMPADMRSSDDKFCHPRFVLSGETEGEARGDPGLFIAGLACDGGLGFGRIERRRRTLCSGRSSSGTGKMTGGPGKSVGEEV
jgi:hypothetical protein